MYVCMYICKHAYVRVCVCVFSLTLVDKLFLFCLCLVAIVNIRRTLLFTRILDERFTNLKLSGTHNVTVCSAPKTEHSCSKQSVRQVEPAEHKRILQRTEHDSNVRGECDENYVLHTESVYVCVRVVVYIYSAQSFVHMSMY